MQRQVDYLKQLALGGLLSSEFSDNGDDLKIPEIAHLRFHIHGRANVMGLAQYLVQFLLP